MPRLKAHPYLLLTLAVFFWAGNVVVARGIHEMVPPFALAFWRWSIALLCVLPLAWPHFKTQWPQVRDNLPTLIVLGLLGVGGYNTFVYIALQTTTAINATILNSFIPIATIIFASLLLRRRFQRLESMGAAISLAGVFLIVAQGNPALLSDLGLNRGDLWMVTAVLAWGLYTVGLQKSPAKLNPMLMFATFAVVGLIALAPAYAWELHSGRRMELSPEIVLAIAYIGIFPGFLGHICYNIGVSRAGPSRGALFINLMPVFGLILATLFLGERAAWYHFAGIACVLTGIVLTTRSRHA